MIPDPSSSEINSAATDRSLSIVIVSWNTREVLQRCLASLRQHCESLDIEIIVVDNDSKDGTVEMLRAGFPSAQIIVNGDNLGFARACNQGMRVAKGRQILLLNSDTYVVDDSISRSVRFLESRPDIAMLGCQIRTPNGRVQHTANRALGIFRGLFEDLWLYRLVGETRWKRILLGGYWDNDSEMEVDWIAGVFMLLRRQVFLDSGGFCEDFFMYGEDSEWCMRLRKAGKRIFFTPLGVVYHIGSVSSDRQWTTKERLRLCYLGDIRAYSKVNGPLLGTVYATTRLLGSAIRALVYGVAWVCFQKSYFAEQCRHFSWRVQFYLEGWLTGAAFRR